MSDYTASRYITDLGVQLSVYDWPQPEFSRPRGLVLLVHGLGEHARRYDGLAQRLNSWGFAVRGYDQHGHGYSDGERGSLPNTQRLLDDLAEVVDDSRSMLARSYRGTVPVLLLGHSMGGVVAAYFVATARRQVHALVLSSPAFDPGLRPWEQRLLRLLARYLPNLRIANQLSVPRLCRDPDVVRAYWRDPQVHDRISLRLAQFITDTGQACVSQAPLWTVPTLLLFAGQDHLVNPAGSRAFASLSPSCVKAHCFKACYHEIFNEPEQETVLECLSLWLAQQCPVAGGTGLGPDGSGQITSKFAAL
ncbi:MAG: lysophospholipase [Burkholderiaceae bacterium]